MGGKMLLNEKFKIQIFILVCLTFGLLLSGCVQATQVPDIPPDPFSARAEGEDGLLVEWSGNSRGHRPGGESLFDLQMVNNSQDPWTGEYCFLLVDLEGVVETFEQANFSLQPGEGFSTTLRTNFPANLADRPYGMMLIIPGRLANTVTIYVGDSHRQSAGPWPQAECPSPVY
jgi:hypothetical protein